MDKQKALSEFINEYPRLYGWLYFNVINIEPNNTALLTDEDLVNETYIDGAEDRNYYFTIAMMKPFDDGTSDLNIEALHECQNFNRWIREKNKLKEFPDWGLLTIINGLEALTDVPTLSVDNQQNVARYTMQIKINYLKLKEEE